jgi:hypothetical protein
MNKIINDNVIVEEVDSFTKEQVATARLLTNAYRAGFFASEGIKGGDVVTHLHQYESVIDDLILNTKSSRLDGIYRKNNACLSVTHEELANVDDYYIISECGKVVGCSP